MLSFVLIAALSCGLPILLFAGWLRWIRAGRNQRQPAAISSLVGFSLGTASVLLAGSTQLFAALRGGFPFYDPKLLLIYKIGLGVSLAGSVAVWIGVSGRSVLRWYAPALSLCMLFLWFLWAAGGVGAATVRDAALPLRFSARLIGSPASTI